MFSDKERFSNVDYYFEDDEPLAMVIQKSKGMVLKRKDDSFVIVKTFDVKPKPKRENFCVVNMLSWLLHNIQLRMSIYIVIADAVFIQSSDWCSFLFDTLCESIRRLNDDGFVKYIDGCVIISLFYYCYLFPF